MTAKILIVMRHAKSSWKTSNPDFARPLSARGTRDAVIAGQVLAPFHLDLVLSSASTRTRQTWQCLTMGGAKASDVRFSETIYHAWTNEVIDELRGVEAGVKTTLLLGHEPTVSDLISTLAQPSELVDQVAAHFPTSAIGILSFDGPWAELGADSAVLQRFEIPRG
ncbi:MAG: histidine phosphatase family protein [Micropruina sp.]